MSNILLSDELAAKFKEYTKIVDYGLSASPFFLRVSGDGKNYTLMVASIESNKETKTSSLVDIYELDVATGNQISRTPAQRYYSTMSQQIDENIPTMRPGIDGPTVKDKKKKSGETFDKILEHIHEYGSISKDMYSEYLKYALYSFSDKLADTLVKLSRTCEIETEHILTCGKCGTRLKINTASIKDGEKIFVTCTTCNNRNVANYKKMAKIVLYGKIYEAIRESEKTPTAPAAATKNDSGIIDAEANLTVSTNATLDTKSSPQIKEITAEQISEEQVIAEDEASAVEVVPMEETSETIIEEPIKAEPVVESNEVIVEAKEEDMEEYVPSEETAVIPEEIEEVNDNEASDEEEDEENIESMYDANIIEVLNKKKEEAATRKEEGRARQRIDQHEVSADGIVALGYQKNAFKVVKDIVGRSDTPNHVFGLKGLNGCGMDLSLSKLAGLAPDYINNLTEERVFNPCTVIDIADGYLAPWIKKRIHYLRKMKGQSIFLKGNTAQWDVFLKNEPVIASYITAIIEFPSYNKEDLFQIFASKIKSYGLNMCDISEETKAELFGTNKEYNNALKATKLASRAYFRAMTINNGILTESDVLKVAKQN